MNNTRVFSCLVLLVFSIIGTTMHAQNFGDELSKEWRTILKISKEEGKYEWFGYPVDNFGVLTSYAPPATKQLTDSDRICATWSCIGVDASKIPTDVVLYTTVNGYADSGAGPAINISNSRQSKAAAALLLNNLLSTLNLNAGVNLSKNVTVTLTADALYKRSVNRDKFTNYMKNAPDGEAKAVFKAGTLAYIGADILAHNIKANISVDTQKSATLNGQLSKAAGALGSGSNLGVTLSSVGNGQYTVTYPGFVILATQMHQEYQPGMLFGGEQSVEQEKQQFMTATAVVPKPQIDPATLKVVSRRPQ